jgi:hypothetical protein
LRFRASNSAYLSRTPTVAGSQTTWTFSAWVKRGSLDSAGTYTLLNCADSGGNNRTIIDYEGTGAILLFYFDGTTYPLILQTTAVYRDPAAWYHIVVVYNSTQATSTNRASIYVNGTQVTSFSSATYPSQNATTTLNSTQTHNIGRRVTYNDRYYDGELTEVNFIDGQALTPNSFGTFNSYGVWQPITYGGSYGTNGFYLPFTANKTSTYAGLFNGSSSYLVPTAPNLFDITSSSQTFTLETWVYANSINASGPQNYRFTEIISKGVVYIGFGFTSTGILRFYTYNGSENYINSGTSVVIAGKWNHLAVVSNAGAVTLYANGVAVATGTLVAASGGGNGSSPRIGTGDTIYASDFFNGYMSNFRITNTAVYTSNFTVPNAPLTAITGTQFLTLQNSSIVDNSTNAYSITNNGSVTTSVQYPNATTAFADQSPAGNNWTPNNISGIAGSTLDYMTDVPTLTSATVANYCVLNPLVTPATTTIINGNLGMSGYTAYSSVTGSLGTSSGKWYFEFVAQLNAIPGITGTPNGSNYPGQASNAYAWDSANAIKYNNNTGVAYGSATSAGDIIGVAFDLDSGSITFYKNNVSQGVAYTFTPSGFYFPCVRNGSATNTSINFGQQPFVYTPPSGFVALNTYNL